MLYVPFPHPPRARSPFRVGRRNAWHFRLARSGLEIIRNFRAPLVFKANFLQLWQPRASFAFLSNVWAKYRLTAHFKPEKVSSLIENVQPRPRGAFPGFRGGALHLLSQRKCQVRLNRARISAPNDSGGSGEWLGGRETLKWSKGGLALSIPPAF